MTQSLAPMGPFCQSCAMPLVKPEDFGTAAEGFRQNDYCAYCYENGAFIDPEITMQAMIDFVTPMVAEQMGAVQARTLMEATIPRLKRWQSA